MAEGIRHVMLITQHTASDMHAVPYKLSNLNHNETFFFVNMVALNIVVC